MEDVIALLDELEYLTLDDPRMIFGKIALGLDKAEIEVTLQKIKAALPNEVTGAANNLRESARIKEQSEVDANHAVDLAKQEAAKIIEAAQQQAVKLLEDGQRQRELLIDTHETTQLARAQAVEIRSSAERDAEALKKGSEQYAADVLGRLEAHLDKLSGHARSFKSEIATQEVGPVGVAIPRGERIRV